MANFGVGSGRSRESVSGAASAGVAPVVEVDWVDDHRGDHDLRIVDVTIQAKLRPLPHMRSGKREWNHAHVPGAAFADLRRICDPSRPARKFMLPDARWFAAAMSQLGIGEGHRVVLYDAAGSMWATYLWWMLRAFGFEGAAVMNGGWTAWHLQGHPTCSTPCAYPPATFTPHPRAGIFVGKEEVLAAIEDSRTSIICASGGRYYRGERRQFGQRRRGHIPTAQNVSASRILDRATQRYLPVHELRELFGSTLDSERVITYCGAGPAASSVAFALHLLGHPNVAIYDGGMNEWSADRRLPLVVGD